jgi:hypothetical protein
MISATIDMDVATSQFTHDTCIAAGLLPGFSTVVRRRLQRCRDATQASSRTRSVNAAAAWVGGSCPSRRIGDGGEMD